MKPKTKSPKQLSLLKAPSRKREHGGSLTVGQRRSRRPLDLKQSLHVTLKSHCAFGGRCLFRHKKMIRSVLLRSAQRFNIRIYNQAIASNHIHLSIRGKTREDIQNFFRVFAGHTAQQILKEAPQRAQAPTPHPGVGGGAQPEPGQLVDGR